jgi:two-component system cell cycle sensor histidine kinase/response regulator CckA
LLSSIHPEDRDRIGRDLRELNTRSHVAREFRIKHADGSYRWARCEFRTIRDEEGGSVEAIGALLDITERKQAEKREAQLRAQLQHAQKMESMGRLAAGVAHDFVNLLTVINGYSDVVLMELASGTPLHQKISQIRTAGERAASLSKQLLTLSRRQVVQAVKLNLNDLIAEVERMLSRVLGAGIHLKSILNPSHGCTLADPGLFHQVLMNLAVNAHDAMPNGGILLIETDNVDLAESYSHLDTEIKPGAYVRLRVSDTSVGMTEEVKSRLFEPFFTTKKTGEGTGLGLATVYGIVKQSGGTISVSSELGHGTTFTIYLPRVDQWALPAPQTVSPAIPPGTETILVAEDHEQLRKLVALILRDWGYTVLEAMR